VVCTERVLAGLADGGFRSGRDLLAASTDEGMERAVAALIEDESARERLARCARQRLFAHYRWAPNLNRLEDLVGAVARPPAGSPAPLPEGQRTAEVMTPAAAAWEARRA